VINFIQAFNMQMIERLQMSSLRGYSLVIFGGGSPADVEIIQELQSCWEVEEVDEVSSLQRLLLLNPLLRPLSVIPYPSHLQG